MVTFLGNHDVKRFLSEAGTTPALLRVGDGLLMTMRGMPQLYAGDELGMVGGGATIQVFAVTFQVGFRETPPTRSLWREGRRSRQYFMAG